MATVEEEEAERLPILSAQTRRDTLPSGTRVYSRRWYVLAVFAASSLTQALVWNTWGPITESAEAVFSWSDATIGMLPNYGNIAYIITVLPMCYFMDEKGLRPAVILCCFLVVLGTALRCITLQSVLATWFANICAVLNGVAGTVPFAGPSLLSSIWFPPDQRATATAIVSFCNYLGVGLSFIIGPQLVSHPVYSNESSETNDSSELFAVPTPDMLNLTTSLHVSNMAILKSDVSRLMYVHCGIAGVGFLLVVLYFPSKPPLPPSITASLERVQYRKGLARVLRNGPLWLIVVSSSIPIGVLGVWASVLDLNVKSSGVSQIDAGWMGFWQTLAGCFSGLLIARFADIFMRRMKLYLIVMFMCAVVSAAWFTSLCNNYIPLNIASLYISCILLGVFINGTAPLFYEISCETSYPVSEGVTGGVLTLANNLSGILFLFVLLIPNIGHSWMNWGLLGSVAFSLPMLFIFPERYRRTDLDIEVDVPRPGDPDDKQDVVNTKYTAHNQAVQIQTGNSTPWT